MFSKLIPFPKKAKSSIGIELGGDSIKMVETREMNGEIHLLSYGIVEIPKEKKGKTQRDASAISPLLQQLLSRCIFPSSPVYFSISGPSVSLQRLKLPPMPENEKPAAIRWQGRKQFPFSLADAQVVYTALGQAPAEKAEPAETELMVAAALNSFIKQELSLFQQSGIEPAGIGALSFAIQDAFHYAGDEYRDKTVALLDIGAEETAISIIKGGELVFARELTTGGNDFTQALTEPFSAEGKQFTLSIEEAEEIKREYGIPMGSSHEVIRQGIPLSRIMFIMRPVLERLVTEALRSFDFYKAQTRDKRIDRIFLCGGGAGLKNLSEFMASSLGIEVSLYAPFTRVAVPPHLQSDEHFIQNQHSFSVALGLSLGRCRDINFLPPPPALLETVDLRTWIPLLALIIFIFSLATAYLRTYRVVEMSREVLQGKSSELNSLKSYMDEMIRLNLKKDTLKKKLAQFPDLSFEQPAFSEMLIALTRMFPDNASLTSMVLVKEKSEAKASSAGSMNMKLRLEGMVFGEGEQVFTALDRITKGLEQSPFFHNVILVSSEKTADLSSSAARFVIDCPVEPFF